MAMTPNDYLESFVEQNLADYKSALDCVRRAFNAAVSASHFVDHFFTYYQRNDPARVVAFKNVTAFANYVDTETGGAFRDIRSIVNAYKHLYTHTDAKRSGYSTISSAGAVESLQLDWDGEIEAVESNSEPVPIGGYRSCVVFTRKDGTRSEVLPVLEKVIRYFSDNLWTRENLP